MLESGDSRNACAICQACSRKSFGNERTTSATARAREASLLRVSRIVGGVDVIDLTRTDAVDLDHRPVVKPGGLTLEQVFNLFPNLKERLGSSQGTKLSGGEQQMLAIGRILRTGARLLLLDEPTEGLAPVIIQQIGKTIRALKEQGFTILLVEQNFRFASTVADRYYVMEHGRIIDQFANAELDANVEKLHDYLGV